MKLFGTTIEILPALLIVLAVVAISLIGGLATDTGSTWYTTLAKPKWQPPAWLFGPVWTMIYLLLALSAILAWHYAPAETRTMVIGLFILNGILNLAWSFIFFRGHSALWAGIEILLLWMTILALIIIAWRFSHVASLLLIPYLIWVAFASVLNWRIVSLN